MSEKFKGSKTEQNLINSFAGEAQARNRYTYYAKICRFTTEKWQVSKSIHLLEWM